MAILVTAPREAKTRANEVRKLWLGKKRERKDSDSDPKPVANTVKRSRANIKTADRELRDSGAVTNREVVDPDNEVDSKYPENGTVSDGDIDMSEVTSALTVDQHRSGQKAAPEMADKRAGTAEHSDASEGESMESSEVNLTVTSALTVDQHRGGQTEKAAPQKADKRAGTTEHSEPSEGEAVESDEDYEDDEDFDVEREPAVSKRKAERVTQQLKQGVSTICSYCPIRFPRLLDQHTQTARLVTKSNAHSRVESQRAGNDEASSCASSDYNADFLEGDNTSANGSAADQEQRGEDSQEDSDASWEATKKHRAEYMQSRRRGNAESTSRADEDHRNSNTDQTRTHLADNAGRKAATRPSVKQTEQALINGGEDSSDKELPNCTVPQVPMPVDQAQRFIVTEDKHPRKGKGKEKPKDTSSDATPQVQQPHPHPESSKEKYARILGRTILSPRDMVTTGLVHRCECIMYSEVHELIGRPTIDVHSLDDLVTKLIKDDAEDWMEPPKKKLWRSGKPQTTTPPSETSKPQKGRPNANARDQGVTTFYQMSDAEEDDLSDEDSAKPAATPSGNGPTVWPASTHLTYRRDGKTAAGIMSQRSAEVKALLSDMIAHELPRALLRVNPFPDEHERVQMFLDMLVDASRRLKYPDITRRLLDDTRYAHDIMKIPIDRMTSVRGPMFKAARDVAWEAYGLKDLEHDEKALKKACRVLMLDNRFISPGRLVDGKYTDFKPDLPFCASPIIQVINVLFFGPNAEVPLADEYFTSMIKTGIEVTQLEIPVAMAAFVATIVGVFSLIREGLEGARQPLQKNQGFNGSKQSKYYRQHLATLESLTTIGRHKLLAYVFKTAKTYHIKGPANRPEASAFVNPATAGMNIVL
ncbi:hypothetical protein EVJ58_g9496 [Rhodofomes roseus]|uniref:DUF6532 domain-containing protein n=1 Tax=Rhodofomes roseus TaxID=34475 RepID=A0A4Y9XXP6_9APHY|nr:hypothetical protein EVJ58_g9496 [Rhodofomes roseus]